jgi:hypothetical protein
LKVPIQKHSAAHLAEIGRSGIFGCMKPLVLTCLGMAMAICSFGQPVSGRQLTRRIEPQLRPAPQPYRPAPGPQQQQGIAPGVRPAAPADPIKAQADKVKNEAKQLEFFKKRAEEGSDHAQYELGMRYLNGRGVAADDKLGREWLSKAAKQGHTQAAKKLEELGGTLPKTAATPDKK